MIDRMQLRLLIPHGYVNKIAGRAGVSQQAVSYYWKGKLNSERIENAALEIAAEIQEAKQKLINRISGE